MEKALKIFEEICKIPHGSGDLDALQAWLVEYAKKIGCEVKTDAVKNIYLKKGKPKVCLQAHYDMVVVGEAAQKKPIRSYVDEKNMLRAHDSSLGADNGIAVATILALFEKYTDFEALITADEETGMYGAKGLDIKVESKTMINLDSEELGEIVISCAGGFDVLAKLTLKSDVPSKKYCYKIESQGFSGGHSGIQIANNIQNAITELARYIMDNDCEVAAFKGGEKRNSIPVHAQAIVFSDEELSCGCGRFKISKEEANHAKIYPNLAQILVGIHSGVLAIDPSTRDVLNSRNLAIVSLEGDDLSLQIMARANKMDMIESNKDNILAFLDAIDVKDRHVIIEGLYAPWENDAKKLENSKLLNLLKSCFKAPRIVNIHAGLECGIIQTRLEEHFGITGMEIFSIGPNIHDPHGVDECLDLASFEEFYSIVDRLLENMEKHF